jgi:outer membrane murein-binding lipoprotein Lpp
VYDMHNFKVSAIIMLALFLSGCASNIDARTNQLIDVQKIDDQLLSAATSIQSSIRAMEQTTNAIALKKMTPEQVEYAREQMKDVPKGLEGLMTTNTYASLRSVVSEAAALSNYRFEEYGKRKKVFVTMTPNLRPIVDVLRDAGNQAKGLAWVCVYDSPEGYTNGVLVINYDGGCIL